MPRWRFVFILALAVPVAMAWWAALAPAVAQSARCAGMTVPWANGDDLLSCGSLPVLPPAGVSMPGQQATGVPTPGSPTAIPTPSPTYPSPTRQTATPSGTPGGASGTPTQTFTPTQTRTVTGTSVPGSPSNTPTFTPTQGPPGSRTATATATFTQGPAGRTPTFTVTLPPPPRTSTPTLSVPTPTVALPRTGDGSMSGGGPNIGLLMMGAGVAGFLVALLLRARRAMS